MDSSGDPVDGGVSEADPTLSDVLAVAITFNPGADLADNLSALRKQIENVAVIDNASSNRAQVEAVARGAACAFVANSANIGLAGALNQARRMAIEGGFGWLATFDQDSRIAPRTIGGLLDIEAKSAFRNRIGVLVPSHRDRGAGGNYHQPFDILQEGTDWRVIRSAITSGSLISTEVLEQVGPFDERLFIDGVDHDFCLRCRKRGYKIVEGTHQVLEHSLGDIVVKRFLGLRASLTNHPPRRRYYMTRNALEVYRRYLTFDPLWSLRGYAHLAVSTILALLYEQQRGAKLKAVLEGARDFALRRFGPYREGAG